MISFNEKAESVERKKRVYIKTITRGRRKKKQFHKNHGVAPHKILQRVRDAIFSSGTGEIRRRKLKRKLHSKGTRRTINKNPAHTGYHLRKGKEREKKARGREIRT